MAFPEFERAWPSGLVNEDVPQPGELNKVDENAANAGNLARQKTTAGTARYGISDGGGGGIANLTEVFADDGFVLASNEVEVPEAGKYLISWGAPMLSDSTSNDIGLELLLFGPATDQSAAGWRRSTDPTDEVIVTNTVVVDITDPPNQKLNIAPNSTAGTPSIGTGPGNDSRPNVLSIVRVSGDPNA